MTGPAILAAFTPVEREDPAGLMALDRAVGEVRRTMPVRLVAADGSAVLVLPVEGCEARTRGWLAALARQGVELVMTGRRAQALGWTEDDQAETVGFTLPVAACEPETLARIADPVLAAGPGRLEAPPQRAPHPLADAAIRLMKVAQLLPAVLLFPAPAAGDDLLAVPVETLRDYDRHSARALRRVSEARVPLAEAEDARIIAFRPADGGPDHLAILVGQPDLQAPVLTRLHSSCITGDLLGSLRCDCGEQLRGAIRSLSEAGGGVVLYLVQEGRGIGIASKLRAYALQDSGLDTVDANEHLGYEPDERDYRIAASMLSQLGIRAVRLMTNNPVKISALEEAGIDVAERVRHAFPANPHNARYLATKAEKSGHLL